MFKKIALIVLLLAAIAAQATTVSGTVTNTTGSALASGTVDFALVSSCSTTLTPTSLHVRLSSSGAIPYSTLVGNDTIFCGSVANTNYQVKAYDASSNLVWTRNYSVTGSSWNIGTAAPLASSPTASSNSGTVTSVGLAAPASDFVVSPANITSSGTFAINWKVPPTNLNSPSSIVKRDALGNFSAGTISADITGNAQATLNTLNAHVSATQAHGVTGAVVGTLNTQTLSNKTLDSSNIMDAGVLQTGTLSGARLPLPQLSLLGGLFSKSCNGTDKMSGIGNDGNPVCTPDQLGTAGTGIQQFNGATLTNQSFAVPGLSGAAPNISTNVTTGVHTFNIPMASGLAVSAGLLTNTDYEFWKGALATDYTSILFLQTGGTSFAFRGSDYGLGREWVPAVTNTIDSLWFPVDTAPSAGYTAANPTLQVFIYDVTAASYLYNQTFAFSQWGGSITSGSMLLRFPRISLIAGHTLRIGMETNTLGLGFPSGTLAPSVNAGFTATNQTDQSSWTSWTYQTVGLAFWGGSNAPGSISATGSQTSIQGVRSLTSTPTSLHTPGATAGIQAPASNYGWGTRFQFVAQTSINVVEFYPIGTITKDARVQVRTVEGAEVLGSGIVTKLEWNTASANNTTSPVTTVKVVLDRTAVIPANTPFNVIYNAQGDLVGFAWMVKTADTVSDRQYYPVTTNDWLHNLPLPSVAVANANTIWMHLYFDPAPKQVTSNVTTTSLTNLNGSTVSTQSFVTDVTGLSPNVSTNTVTGVHTINVPHAGYPGVTEGGLSNTAYEAFASAARRDTLVLGWAQNMAGTPATAQFLFRGTQLGLGSIFTPTTTVNFDTISIPMDPTPNTGYTTANPKLAIFINDQTSTSYLLQRTFSWAEWGAAMTSGRITVRVGQKQLLANHTYRIGMSTDTLGLGFAQQMKSSGGFTSTFASGDATAWTSWSYGNGALAFQLYQSSPEIQRSPLAAEGVRQFVSAPAAVGPVPGTIVGSSGTSLQEAWGTQFAPASTFTTNVIEFYPTGTISSTGHAHLAVRDLTWSNVDLASAEITSKEWAYYAALGQPIKVLLNTPITITAGQNIVVYYHAYGELVQYNGMSKTSETVGERRYVANGTNVTWPATPDLGIATAASSVVYFKFYNDAHPSQTAIMDTSSLAAGARTSLKGNIDILLPSNLYVMQGTTSAIEEANIYWKSAITGFWYDFSNLDVTGSYGRQYKDFWRIRPGDSDGTAGTAFYNTTAGLVFPLTVSVMDAEFTTVSTATTTVNVVSKASPNPCRYMAIGDSLTYDNYPSFNKYPTQVRLSLGCSLVGTRSVDNDITNVEGRGGWWLAKGSGDAQYFGYANASGLDSPFMFPLGVDGTLYRGNTAFWKNATTQDTAYDWQGFQRIAREWATTGSYLYDVNGYPTSPQTGWVVYDPTLAAGHNLQTWNGTGWVDYSNQAPGWAFDFSKYMARYVSAFPNGAPTHISILFGANDFQTANGTAAGMGLFASSLQTMVSSIHSYDPTIKIIIATPPTGAHQDGWGYVAGDGQYAERYRRNIQEEQRRILTDWDSTAQRTANVYVAPTSFFVDPTEYDYVSEPASKYSSTTVNRFTNFVHPNLTGYKQIGDGIAAIVQLTR